MSVVASSCLQQWSGIIIVVIAVKKSQLCIFKSCVAQVGQ